MLFFAPGNKLFCLFTCSDILRCYVTKYRPIAFKSPGLNFALHRLQKMYKNCAVPVI